MEKKLTEKQLKKKEYNDRYRERKRKEQEELELVKHPLTFDGSKVEKIETPKSNSNSSNTVIDKGEDKGEDFFFVKPPKQKTQKKVSFTTAQQQIVAPQQTSLMAKLKEQMILQTAMMTIPLTFSILSKLTPLFIQKWGLKQSNTEQQKEEQNLSNNTQDILSFTF